MEGVLYLFVRKFIQLLDKMKDLFNLQSCVYGKIWVPYNASIM